MPIDATTLRSAFESAGQGHVFGAWDTLEADAQHALTAQAAEIDLAEVAHLYDTLVTGAAGGKAKDFSGLEPAPYIPYPANGGDAAPWATAQADGEALLRAGKVAAFTVAGGQGTRLGYDGPKGTFPVTPVTQKTLFQLFAEKIAAARARYGCAIPWAIMTSHANDDATRAFFAEHQFFGLPEEDVIFFAQGRMPAVDADGKILMETLSQIAMSPDGHGGSLRALVRSGTVAALQARGIDTLSYFQVDNPLVQFIDPAFLGFHRQAGSEMSSKMIPKAYPLEKVGHFCRQDGQTVVIEYSDLPDAMQEETLADGSLRFIAGSIAIHVLDLDFVARVGSGAADVALPFHRAHKKVAVWDAGAGKAVKPDAPNGYKFEMFVFDALPFAANPVIIETRREDDFSPVKNAEGVDSAQTARDDQLRQFARWVNAAGVGVPVDETGLPSFAFEVAPGFATSAAEFAEKWQALAEKPALAEGVVLA